MKKILKFTIKVLQKHHKRIGNALIKLKFLSYKIDFGERDDDIYIVTFPKSGSTLMQMILYQLTTDGNMDFEHIYDVSPWTRNDAMLNKPPRELPSPRIIKSHDFYNEFSMGRKGRFIFVHREGKDCAVSNWFQEMNYRTTSLGFEKYLQKFLSKDYNWFTFTMDWFENRKNLPVLYLRYEDLLNNFEESIKKICHFCKIDMDKIDYDRIYERTRFDYMKSHEDKFGVGPTKAEKEYNEFIRKGKSGEGPKHFPKNFSRAFDKAYQKHILPLEEKIGL